MKINQKFNKIANQKRKARGFVLQELAVAVLILSAIGLAGWTAYKVITSDNAVDLERDAILSDVTRGFGVVESEGDSSTVTTALFITNNVFKTGVAGSIVKNKFGGTTEAAPASTALGTNDAILWTKNGYTTEACTDVTRKIDNIAYSISVNGTAVKTATTKFNSKTLGESCKSTNDNIVTFVTARR